MKRLYLLRHAKSDRSDPDLVDSKRPLNRRGRRAAPAIGRLMRKEKLIPDVTLCSTARRTLETWEALAPALKTEVPLKTSRRLYLAGPGQILRQIRELPEAADSALVIGHNPGLQSLALDLVGGGDAAGRTRLAAKLPTAGLVVLDFPVDQWSEIGAGAGTLERFVAPRDLA
jgi:phosphohistidine phosphatase